VVSRKVNSRKQTWPLYRRWLHCQDEIDASLFLKKTNQYHSRISVNYGDSLLKCLDIWWWLWLKVFFIQKYFIIKYFLFV
jgi:hypothetical protein